MGKDDQNKEAKKWWEKLFYFFPIQLTIVHVKKNQQLILFWVLLFLTVTQQFGTNFGLHLIFLEPEYLGEISFWSYFILGFCLGGFVMAFNIASYIMNGFRFPFLATLSKPFLKYCINNAFFPFLFLLVYFIETFRFLTQFEELEKTQILIYLSGFLIGYLIFVCFATLYFLATNKDFEKLFGKEISKIITAGNLEDEPARLLLHRKKKHWYKQRVNQKSWRVDSYISGKFKLRFTRAFDHYNFEMLSAVFRQNHVNASFFEIALIVSIIVLGIFRDNELFIIPAAASIILLVSMVLMAVSAIRSWLRGWTAIVLLFVVLGLNFLTKFDDYYFENRLYGLDHSEKVVYNPSAWKPSQKAIYKDRAQTIKRLEAWKKKNMVNAKNLPAAVFLCSSGGGSRSMLWSFVGHQELNALTKGELMDHSILSTGSSGGLIGAAYYRELVLRAQENDGLQLNDLSYRDDLAADLLNPIFFTIAVNDMVIRSQRFVVDGQSHWKDRGFAFEKTLNDNCRGLLDKRLGDYTSSEDEAKIPMMVFSPSVVNEGRRMLIGSQGLSYLCRPRIQQNNLPENIDYMQLFGEEKAKATKFSSLLRVSASAPYIMPIVSLPTKPSMELFDSGLRDNYGIKTTVNFIHEFKEWLNENTSEIVILQFRDGIKHSSSSKKQEKRSIINEFLSPVGSLYGNLFQAQDFNNDELLDFAKEWYPGKLHILNYQLNKNENEKISLSWHLTANEKKRIYESVFLKENKLIEKQLTLLLNETP